MRRRLFLNQNDRIATKASSVREALRIRHRSLHRAPPQAPGGDPTDGAGVLVRRRQRDERQVQEPPRPRRSPGRGSRGGAKEFVCLWVGLG